MTLKILLCTNNNSSIYDDAIGNMAEVRVVDEAVSFKMDENSSKFAAGSLSLAAEGYTDGCLGDIPPCWNCNCAQSHPP